MLQWFDVHVCVCVGSMYLLTTILQLRQPRANLYICSNMRALVSCSYHCTRMPMCLSTLNLLLHHSMAIFSFVLCTSACTFSTVGRRRTVRFRHAQKHNFTAPSHLRATVTLTSPIAHRLHGMYWLKPSLNSGGLY